MAPPPGRRRMGARETTPTTTNRPGHTAKPPSHPPTPAGGSSPHPDDRPPLAGIQLVRPRRYAAPGAPTGPRPHDGHNRAATRKATTPGTAPNRRPATQVTGSDHHALLTAKAPMGALLRLSTSQRIRVFLALMC